MASIGQEVTTRMRGYGTTLWGLGNNTAKPAAAWVQPARAEAPQLPLLHATQHLHLSWSPSPRPELAPPRAFRSAQGSSLRPAPFAPPSDPCRA